MLWDSIQTELGGKVIYIPKINAKETQSRDELIKDLFYKKNKSVEQLSDEFGLCRVRIWQIIKVRGESRMKELEKVR
jgi:Mor family transcriptional regulator